MQGTVADGVEAFLGIPYAAPPVGSLRWTPPQPAARWNGIRQATSFGSYCPQNTGVDEPAGSVNEDCLFVNVQRPVGTTSADRLPVFVYIHGGGNVEDGSNSYNMALIVTGTPVVAVTLNYRLGALGFLALPGLATNNGQEDGNYGFEDQQAALRWVRRNIASFGGDPTEVTLGGQSAGAIDACSHLAAPRSKGLFSRAIIQSGQCLTDTLAVAEKQATAVAASLGCDDASTTVSCMRGVPVETLLSKQPTFFLPTSGTLTLPVDTSSRISTGTFTHVPILIGSTRDETRSFTQPAVGFDADEYTSVVLATFGANAKAVLRHYPFPVTAGTPADVAYQIAATFTDPGAFVGSAVENGIGGCATSLLTDTLAKYLPVFSYEFSNRNGPGWYPVPGYKWGAGHATDLPYLYLHPFYPPAPTTTTGSNVPTLTGSNAELSYQMVKYWGAFIANGDPAVPGQAAWPSYNRASTLLQLKGGNASGPLTEADFRDQHHCAFWDRLRGADVQGFVTVPDDERGG